MGLQVIDIASEKGASEFRGEILLEQFESDVAPPLIEFSKSLTSLETDVAMFVARKSLCLFDVLQLSGAPPLETMVLSDRFLDCDLSGLAGKHVTLVDDTLIIGTSLAKAKAKLELAGARVSTIVFCRNSDTAGDDPILRPDQVWLDLDESRTRTFCASEVRAFSLAPRPYLVDFPFFRPVQLEQSDFALLLTSIRWNVTNITSTLQARRGVEVYSCFPSQSVMEEFRLAAGGAIADIVDIVKVRAFCSMSGPDSSLLLVPLVTLKPLTTSNVKRLLAAILTQLLPDCESYLREVLSHVKTPEGRQRLIQWLLSAAWGHRFFSSFPEAAELQGEVNIDEACRHYGPDLREFLGKAAKSSRQIWDSPRGSRLRDLGIDVSPLPVPPIELATSVMPASEKRFRSKGGTVGDMLVTDFAGVFLDMYRKLEVPAREKARELGPEVVNAKAEDRRLIDRLETGLAWSSIVESFDDRYGNPTSSETSNAYSLALDICNDLGISVPVTTECDGVVFRAWRHGEDVLFSDQEMGLIYNAVEGALLASGRFTIQKLQLEKLIVVLIHAGIAKNFLQPVYSDDVAGPQAKVSFDLKGAVPKIVQSPPSRAPREIWMSSQLLKRDVLRETEKGPYELVGFDPDNPAYGLSEHVQGAYVNGNARIEAFSLGYHLGALFRAADGKHDDAPLNETGLIVLATCWPPRNVAAAIQSEIDIVREWLDDSKRTLREVQLADGEPEDGFRSWWRLAKGREALFSARMKFVAHKSGRHRELVEECAAYLHEHSDRVGPTASLQWKGYWHAMGSGVPVQEGQRVSDSLVPAMRLVYALMAALAVCDVALEAALAKDSKRRADFIAACKRALDLRDEMDAMGYTTRQATRIFARVEEIERDGPESLDLDAAWSFGVSQLESLRTECNGVIDALEPLLSEFGRLATKQEFEYVVWYDIVDSMGNERANRDDDVRTFREEELPRFRVMVNTRLLDITQRALQSGVEIHCWNGSLTSNDDQKHIYLTGDDASRWAGQVVGEIHRCLEAFPSVHVRALVAPCSFAGGRAYRMRRDPAVAGASFIEQFKRLTEAVTEQARALCDHSSYLSLVGGLTGGTLGFPEHMVFVPENGADPIRIQAAGTELAVEALGGRFGPLAQDAENFGQEQDD